MQTVILINSFLCILYVLPGDPITYSITNREGFHNGRGGIFLILKETQIHAIMST